MSDAITRAIDADEEELPIEFRGTWKRMVLVDPERIARLELLEKLETEARRSVARFGVTPELHGINSWLAALDAQRAPDAGRADS